MERFPPIDLHALAAQEGVELEPALEELRAIYADVDARNEVNTKSLDLPCHRGCDACCHESVFLTPLEFFGAWDWIQQNLEANERERIIEKGLALYAENQAVIEALSGPVPEGESDHFKLAAQLRYRCPILGEDGGCRVYPMRELLARLFGCSFNAEGGVYGCHLVGEHLAGKVVTLLPTQGTAARLKRLPLSEGRQVYPYYIHWLYGE